MRRSHACIVVDEVIVDKAPRKGGKTVIALPSAKSKRQRLFAGASKKRLKLIFDGIWCPEEDKDGHSNHWEILLTRR